MTQAQTQIQPKITSKAQQSKGIYINGKMKAMELLQHMSLNERTTLLKLIKTRNSNLADELMSGSISFEEIGEFSNETIIKICNDFPPQLIGIALKTMNEIFQKKILRSLPRQYAEAAFQVLKSSIKNEKENSFKAQRKILEKFGTLMRSKQIHSQIN